MNKEIKYIGYYSDDIIEQENRVYFLSAVNKMNYIRDSLIEIGLNVCMVSTSNTKETKKVKIKGKEFKINDKLKIKTFNTFGAKNKIFRILRKLKMDIQLFKYLLKNTQRNEQIIVYHSISIILPILIAKKIKKFKIILELEEKYQDINKMSSIDKYLENKMINNADKYIYATELFKEIIEENKPYVICNGVYNVQKKYNESFKDDKIHIIYAGIIDKIKKGAFSAAELALHLDSRYHIHIIGFGNENDIKELKDYIDKNKKDTTCIITYDGIYKGEEYTKFLQKCDIGLSTQDSTLQYNNTSFPSKILSYLSNGLRVVTVRISVIEKSKIGDIMYYYDENNCEQIARKIRSINLDSFYDSRQKINELDKEFKKEIKKLILQEEV